MLPLLLGGLAAAPLYWLAVPDAWRRTAATALSLVGLAVLDPRLPVLVGVTALACRLVAQGPPEARWRGPVVVAALAALVALFVWNKHAGGASGPLATQGALALVGTSYLVLKAAAVLIDAWRGDLTAPPRPGALVAWLAFAPIYVAGPIEPFEDFRDQRPTWDAAAVLRGCERILLGAVKALVVAHWLGVWATPVLAAPGLHGRLATLAALHALTLRFYLDFAGYSDIAIGFAAVFGWRIRENFDRPFVQRNLVHLWQHWHMTLTHWLRVYLFVPTSRLLLRRVPALDDRVALALAQAVTMGACGLWHGVSWNFLVWGLLQALGLAWIGLAARDAARTLPAGLVAWWRRSPVATVCATVLTVEYFTLSLVFVVRDVPGALALLQHLLG